MESKKKNPEADTDALANACRGDGCDMFDDLDHGWAWMEMIASFGTFCLIGGTMYAVGIIHSTLLDQFNRNVSITSWAGALHSALISAGGPLSSALIDRFSCRTAIVSSGVCYVIGYLGTAFAPNLETAIFTCGMISGIGGAFGYTASMVVVGFNFRKRLNLALGFALCGIGVGLCAMAPVMQFARDYYGTTGFFIILATCALNIITFGVMCFPSKLEKDAQAKRKLEAGIQKVSTCRKSKILAMANNYVHILLNKGVLCLCCSMFNFCMGTFVVYLHLPTYIVACGFTHVEASFFVSISGMLTVFGRMITGVIANLNCLPDICLYSGSMGIVSIATFLLPHYSVFYWGQILYAILLGLFFGSCYVVLTSVNIQLVGINYMSAAIGLEFFFGGIGALAGPVFAVTSRRPVHLSMLSWSFFLPVLLTIFFPSHWLLSHITIVETMVSGVIVDSGASYDHSFYIAASCILLATVSSAATLCFRRTEQDGVKDVEVDLLTDKSLVLKDSMLSNESKLILRDGSLNDHGV